MKTKHLKMIVTISLLLTLVFALGMMSNINAKAVGTSAVAGTSGGFVSGNPFPAVEIPWWTGAIETGTGTGGGKDPNTNPSTGPQDFLPIAMAFSSVSAIFSGVALINKKRK